MRDGLARPHPVRRKWRPSIGIILLLVLTTVLALPLVGLFFFRIYENQLIHQTEAELIGQSAVLAAVMRREIEAGFPPDVPLGAPVAPTPPAEPGYAPGPTADPPTPYRPIMPALDLTSDDLLGRRPEARPAPAPPHPAFLALGARLTHDVIETQRVTLAGFRLLDPAGTVIAGREEVGLSLAHVEEVAEALRGHFRSAMRLRVSKHEPPPLYSWSRGTGVRLFTAMPVVVRGQVAAIVYASRTPSNVFRSFYEERRKIALAALSIAALTLLIGFVFHRTITRPMRELMRRTAAIGRGERDALTPLAHHGTAEFAQLSQSFLDMATSLHNRSDFIATFAAHVSHELKSPLTAIQGAAELLRDGIDAPAAVMSDDDRRRFLDNIIADAGRLTAIVQRLRELARAENPPTAGTASLGPILADLRSAPGSPPQGSAPDSPLGRLDIRAAGDLDGILRMSAENTRIVLTHLADNAAHHGATWFAVSAVREFDRMRVTVRDDGGGISASNRARIFDSFFTTRRESGGTGMGLAIVRAMLAAHGGSITLAEDGPDAAQGATFTLHIPLAGPLHGPLSVSPSGPWPSTRSGAGPC